MDKKNKILKLIQSIRESFVGAEQVYTNGSCVKLYRILKVVFPEAIPYYDNWHVITKIDNSYYDINGEVDIDTAQSMYNKVDICEQMESWIFNIYDIHVDCPNCGEFFFRGELENDYIKKQ